MKMKSKKDDLRTPLLKTLEKYAKVCGTNMKGAMRDTLTEILHYCGANSIDFSALLQGAEEVYDEEEKEALNITQAQRNAVTEAMGYEIGDEEIADAVSACESYTDAGLAGDLNNAQRRFKRQGGRGVELADEIDTYRIALAVRKVPVKAN